MDRRRGSRLFRELPVKLSTTLDSAKVAARTRDISSSGVFLYTEARLSEGANVDLILMLPPELTDGTKSWVCCHAKVVRVEPGAGREVGVAAEIQRMDVLPELAG